MEQKRLKRKVLKVLDTEEGTSSLVRKLRAKIELGPQVKIEDQQDSPSKKPKTSNITMRSLTV